MNLVPNSGNSTYWVESIDNKPALIRIMVWHLAGDKPLVEPVLA